MNIEELRSKEEITRDIEETRMDVTDAFQETKESFVGRNPGVLAWRATKSKFNECKDALVEKTEKTDYAIQSNIYRSLGIALGAGLIVGLLATSRKTKKKCCD